MRFEWIDLRLFFSQFFHTNQRITGCLLNHLEDEENGIDAAS